MHDLRADSGELKHRLGGDRFDRRRVGDGPRVGREDSRHVGQDVAVRERSGLCDLEWRRRWRPPWCRNHRVRASPDRRADRRLESQRSPARRVEAIEGLDGSTRRIVPAPWRASVEMPIRAPTMLVASSPRVRNAIAMRAAETCSPVASSTSSSRGVGRTPATAPARVTSRSVAWPIAETTTATRSPPARIAATCEAAARSSSGVPSDVPPNLSTRVLVTRSLPAPRRIFHSISRSPPLWTSRLDRPACDRFQRAVACGSGSPPA